MRVIHGLAVIVLIAAAPAVRGADYVWLRQTGNSNPNGNGVYQNGSGSTGGGTTLPFFITNSTPNALQLSHGTMGVSAYIPYGLKTSEMYASVWTPAGFFAGNPLAPGDLVAHASVPPPAITAVGTGQLFGIPTTNYLADWDTAGSLRSLNFILQPGQSAYFTISVPHQGNDQGHWFGRESTSDGPSDILWGSGGFGYQPFADIPWTEFSGYLEGDWAFVPVFQKGDVNCDGARNVLDVAPFVEALIDPAAYAGSFPDCGLLSADMNGDGRVNGLDIAGFTNCLLAGECP